MQALKDARKLIERQPDGETAKMLSALVLALALESKEIYAISDLYKLNYDDFGLALALLTEWRLDQYYTKKTVLLDLSSQVVQMGAASTTSPVLAETGS